MKYWIKKLLPIHDWRYEHSSYAYVHIFVCFKCGITRHYNTLHNYSFDVSKDMFLGRDTIWCFKRRPDEM